MADQKYRLAGAVSVSRWLLCALFCGAQKAVHGGGRRDRLMNGKLRSERRATIIEPPLRSGPLVDGGIDGLIGPIMIPRPQSLLSLLAPWTIGDDSGMEAADAVIPGIHVKDMLRMARSQARRPGHVQRVGAQKVVCRGIERREIEAGFLR